MSLADELLADLEEPDHRDAIDEEVPMDMTLLTEEIAAEAVRPSLRQEAKLFHSEKLQLIMKQIEAKFPNMRKSEEMCGPVEADPEYQLIIEANNIAVEIDDEISVIYKFTRDRYSKRFPELESLVVSPLEYMMTVKQLGNDLESAKNNERLQQSLTQATIMVVSVTASTTQGQDLSEEELNTVFEGCDMAMNLNNIKLRIYEYVESRMTFIAPNLSAIVGAATAAKIMGVAGGLTTLSKMPACNIMLIGCQKKTLSGFAQTNTLPHTGFIYYARIVQDTPPDLRRKAARLVSAKVALAARVDSFYESLDGIVGNKLREEVEKKLDKLQEPPPVKSIKPLPAPIDIAKKRRGGRRVRKMKERYAVTEMRKQANRMPFADIEEDAYQNDLGYTRGLMGKGGTGRIRAAIVDEKTKVRISKTLQRNLQRQQVYGGSTTIKKQVSGTASSVAFTPLQGLEIVNPQAAEKKISEANNKYFSTTSGFLQLKK